MTYLWVALGSALGGVARFGFGALAEKLWGAAFPWGTILINIAGSFVIGFFGTLTATADGRFSVPPETRAFVMVGLCGGFTTFSSFSLQTLDLARDGRPGQALANIALSVVLCLAAVAAGHYGAAALNGARVVQEAEIGAAEAPRVLVILERPEHAAPLLAAAGEAARLMGVLHLDLLAVTPAPAAPVLPGEEIATAEREAEIAARGGAQLNALRAAVEGWLARSGPATAQRWSAVEGAPGGVVAERARAARLTLISAPGGDALRAALFEARCPVLVLPPGAPPPSGMVAVAWEPGPACESALRAALPWLRRASTVLVLHAGAEMPGLLLEEGIAAAAEQLPDKDWVAAARAAGAGMLVAGAQPHRALPVDALPLLVAG